MPPNYKDDIILDPGLSSHEQPFEQPILARAARTHAHIYSSISRKNRLNLTLCLRQNNICSPPRHSIHHGHHMGGQLERENSGIDHK